MFRKNISGVIIFILILSPLLISIGRCEGVGEEEGGREITITHSSLSITTTPSDPATITFTYEDATENDLVSMKVLFFVENELVALNDSFGDPLFTHTRNAINQSTISIRAGNLNETIYEIQIQFTYEIDPSNPATIIHEGISYNAEGEDRYYYVNANLTVNTDESFFSKRTYTTDDLRGMSVFEIIEYYVILAINSYGWIFLILIISCVCRRYNGMRKSYRI